MVVKFMLVDEKKKHYSDNFLCFCNQMDMVQDGKQCQHTTPRFKMQQIMLSRPSSRGLTHCSLMNCKRSFMQRQRSVKCSFCLSNNRELVSGFNSALNLLQLYFILHLKSNYNVSFSGSIYIFKWFAFW